MGVKIAICDDEQLTCCELEENLTEYFGSRNIKVEIDVFYDAENFCRYLENNHNYDLIFLDIEFENLNGIEAGEYIRNELHDDTSLIIYISSKERYALQLFKIGTFEFLIKPIDTVMLEKVMDRALKKINAGKHYFEYSMGKNYYRIKFKDIIFFQSNLRKIQIKTNNETVEFYGKLQEINKQLPVDMFMQIHNSYIVNINHVKEYAYEYVRMFSDDVITISKKYRKTVREKILDTRRKTDD